MVQAVVLHTSVQAQWDQSLMKVQISIYPPMISKYKLGNKERFDKKQIGIKEPFPVSNLPFTS